MIFFIQFFQLVAGIIIAFLSLIIIDWLESFVMTDEEKTERARRMEIFLYGDCDF